MADASRHATDEYGFSLTASQRLRRMQGVSPSNGEYFRAPAAIESEDASAPLNFTLREFNDAVLDNVTRDMLARIKRK